MLLLRLKQRLKKMPFDGLLPRSLLSQLLLLELLKVLRHQLVLPLQLLLGAHLRSQIRLAAHRHKASFASAFRFSWSI